MRLTSVILLFAFLLPLGGGIGFWHIKKKMIQKEVKRTVMRGLEKDQLVFFEFDLQSVDTSVNWKHGKEFEWNQVLYDVVFRDTVEDKIQLWCFPDTEETYAEHQILELAKKQHESDPEQSEFWKDYFKSVYYYQDNGASSIHIIKFNSILQFLDTCKIFRYQIDLSSTSPPPRFV